jgi:hypothetical protein
MPEPKITLKEFYAIYAKIQQFDHIPQFHLDLLDVLEKEQWDGNSLVVQIFRNGSKSSLSAVYVAWKLVCDPTKLFLIQSADQQTSRKTISDIRKIITVHPFAQHLRGGDTIWAADGVEVNGSTSGRNLSVSARGIFSNVTGGRADYIIYDDCEVPKNAASAELRIKLRERISESYHLLNPGGKRIFIGTPHSWESIYPEEIDKGATSFRVPLLNNLQGEFPNMKGDCAWPQRWSEEEILAKQIACKSKNEFYSQYQLIPATLEEATLDPALLQTYTIEPNIVTANRSTVMFLGKAEIKAIKCFWDPALSKANGDNSVLSIAMCDKQGNIYLHRTYDIVGDATEQCKRVRDLLIKHQLSYVRIETNGIGAFLPQMLLQEVRGLEIAVDGKATTKNKSDSILQAFETPISGRFIFVHEQVMKTKFVQQMKDFNPRFMRGKDDFIDAGAKVIELLPVRLSSGTTISVSGFKPFRSNGETLEVQREYMAM